jgi:transcription elongation factor Elf1
MTQCPECESDNTEPMEVDEDDGVAYMVCNECDNEWEEEL